MKYFAFVTLFFFVLVGCNNVSRSINKSNLTKISLGDSKARVLEICGTPEKNEQFVKGGSNFEVLFFYTDYIGEKSWETGHTPVLVKNGVVVGIGARALRVNGIESSDFSLEIKSRE